MRSRASSAPPILVIAFLCATLPGAGAQATRPESRPEVRAAVQITARVDPRVELLSIIFRLARSPEYVRGVAESPYSRAVDARFTPFADHEAVALAAEMRRTAGVSHDAVMSFALHLADTVTFSERVPFDFPGRNLDPRWTPDAARRFRDAVARFARDTEFAGFMAEHREVCQATAERLEERVNGQGIIEFCDDFFGRRPTAELAVIAGPLIGGNNFGISVLMEDGTLAVSPVIGVWRQDASGTAVFGADLIGLLVHEFSHTYANPLVKRHAEDLSDVGTRLLAWKRPSMTRQAYVTPEIVLCESFVRMATVHYWRARGDAVAAAAQVRIEHRHGFVWTRAFADRVDGFVKDRRTWPILADFMPEIVAFFDELEVGDAPTSNPSSPAVVQTSPESGAAAVDPTVSALVVTFSKPMKDQSWSVCLGSAAFPRLVGKPSYDATRTVLTIPVVLEPATEYELWLNTDTYKSFLSAQGTALEPWRWTFRTR